MRRARKEGSVRGCWSVGWVCGATGMAWHEVKGLVSRSSALIDDEWCWCGAVGWGRVGTAGGEGDISTRRGLMSSLADVDTADGRAKGLTSGNRDAWSVAVLSSAGPERDAPSSSESSRLTRRGAASKLPTGMRRVSRLTAALS